MTVLEAWLLAAAVASAKPEQPSDAPPVELLEFLGSWSVEEQKLIDQAAPPKKRGKPRGSEKDDVDNESPTRSGPPR